MIRRRSRPTRWSRRAILETLEMRQLLAADGLSLAGDRVEVTQNSGPILVDVLANDSFDSDYAGERRITGVSSGSRGGRIEIQDGWLKYTAPADTTGVETFQYQVDGAASAQVTVDIVSPLRPFTTTVALSPAEQRLDLLAGAAFDEGYEGDKRITLISETALGAEVRISQDGQSVWYQPRIGFPGRDEFGYIVDGRFVGTAVVNVTNPLLVDRFEVVQKSDPIVLDLLANDFPDTNAFGEGDGNRRDAARITHVLDSSDEFDVQIVDEGRAVRFALSPDSLRYSVSFRYVVDSQFEQQVTVYTSRPVNNDVLSADADGGVHTLDVLQNDNYWSALRNRRLDVIDRVTAVTPGDRGGTIAIAADGLSIQYTPATGFIGNETFQYTADDLHQATVTVNVSSPVRDDWLWVREASDTTLDVLSNDFSGELAATATITDVGASEIGATIRFDDRHIYYTPPEHSPNDGMPLTEDHFQYTINGTLTANVTVRVLPLTTGDFFRIDRAVNQTLDVLANDHFENYDGPGRITNVSAPSGGGTASVSVDGGAIDYLPGEANETFTYTVDDRFTETVRLATVARLRSDRAVADQNGPAISIDVLKNDFPAYSGVIRDFGPYQGPRQVTSVSESTAGAEVSVAADGTVSYTPPAGFVGRDSFRYTVDGFLVEAVTVNVISRAADDLVRVSAVGESQRLNVLANDILGADYTGPGLITDVTDTVAGGLVTIAADGRSLEYTPPSGFVGEDQFVYAIDGQSEATVTVVVGDADGLLSQFASSDELRDYLIERSVERYQSWFENPLVWLDPNRDLQELEATGTAGDFSLTNVQVAGVDEDDVVETDGDFIYSLRGNELLIVDSQSAGQLELLSRTQIEGTPEGMFLNGDRVTVISRLIEFVDPLPLDDVASGAIAADRILYPSPSQVSTIVTVLDVTDRAQPRTVQRTVLDGSFASSRRIGDQVFLVLNSQELLIQPESVCLDESSPCRYESEEEFVERVTREFASIIETVLPGYESYDADGELTRGGPLLLPEDIYRSPEADATSMTVVVSLNMASVEPGLSATTGVLSNSSSEIFASPESLYVFNSYRESIENEPWTRILRFDWVAQSGAVDFAAMGEVPGRLHNQFSADEFEGRLRVVTEISNSFTGNFSGNAETGVFVLENDGGVMEFVGSLQNLAVGQNVKSVRFFGDQVFVTNFSDFDPLYAIDLSDPRSPKSLGHVPIPGFSTYMQLIAPDRLLTMGVNSATGFGGRAMVTLFDVADLTEPRVIDQFNLPRNSRSTANLDHHAFGWFARHDLLAVPMSRNFAERFDDDQDGYPEAIRMTGEDALSLLKVGSSEAGISLLGQIDHTDAVLRSVYIGDHVYSVGLDAVRSVNLGDPATIQDEVLLADDTVVGQAPVPRGGVDVESLALAARAQLADHANVDPSRVMLIAHEIRADAVDFVLSTGGQRYHYQNVGDEFVLTEDDFEFVEHWHNESNPHDVNNDGTVTANDALMVINEMSRRASGSLPVDRVLRQIAVADRFADTNGDGFVTAVDALRVINAMARAAASQTSKSEIPLSQAPGSGLANTNAAGEDDEHESTPQLF